MTTQPSLRVEKPWDRFEQYTHNLPSTVKIITVDPGFPRKRVRTREFRQSMGKRH